MSVSSVVRASVASLALAVVAVLGVAMPAVAHDAPTGESNPAAGSTVTAVPSVVTVEFTADIDAQGAEGVILGADKIDWADGNASVEGSTLSIPVKADIPNGTYTVTWRVVYGDGHPASEAFTFTLDAPETATPTTAAPSTAAPTPTASREITPAPTTSAPTAADNTARVVPWFLGTVIILVLIGAVAAVIGRSRRS